MYILTIHSRRESFESRNIVHDVLGIPHLYALLTEGKVRVTCSLPKPAPFYYRVDWVWKQGIILRRPQHVYAPQYIPACCMNIFQRSNIFIILDLRESKYCSMIYT